MKLTNLIVFAPLPLLTVTVCVVALASCTGGGDPSPPTAVSPGGDAATSDVQVAPPVEENDGGPITKLDSSTPLDGGGDTNPEGVPYPTDKIGINARKGATPGNRIANLKFLGYPNGNKTGGLQPISLAQFYDPTHKHQRILHLQASGVWSTSCHAQAKAVAPMKSQLDAKEVVWFIAIAEGPTPGTASKQKDLDDWLAALKVPCTHVLDPGSANFGPLFDVAAFPWNANIDTRTMEILTSGAGGLVSEAAILDDLDDALTLAASSTL
jgi:hypothetical protein